MPSSWIFSIGISASTSMTFSIAAGISVGAGVGAACAVGAGRDAAIAAAIEVAIFVEFLGSLSLHAAVSAVKGLSGANAFCLRHRDTEWTRLQRPTRRVVLYASTRVLLRPRSVFSRVGDSSATARRGAVPTRRARRSLRVRGAESIQPLYCSAKRGLEDIRGQHAPVVSTVHASCGANSNAQLHRVVLRLGPAPEETGALPFTGALHTRATRGSRGRPARLREFPLRDRGER